MPEIKLNIVDALPSLDYKPTMNLAMLHVVSGRSKNTTVIQQYDSTVPGQEPVWKALPNVIATQQPKLIVVPGNSRN